MALLDVEAIRMLASFKPVDRPVVSVYLDVDGRRWPRIADVESRVERLVATAIAAASKGRTPPAVDDLRRVQAHVGSGLDRSRMRGLVVFSCGDQLWEVFELPVRVKDHVVVDRCAHVRQLEAVVDNYPGFGMLLVDKQRARMFVFELNRLVDKNELFDALPRHDDEAGDRDRGQRSHLASHLESVTQHHLKRAAALAFETWKDHPFDHLLLAAGPEVARELEVDLHTYLKDRIAARVHLAAGAPEAVIVAAALDLQERLERQREVTVVNRLREAAGSGRGGVVGLDAVLAALSARRIETLVVSDGFEAAGWRCDACGMLAARGRTCPTCGARMAGVPDVVEDAVEQALLQACHVEVCVGNADLDVAGRIGALLRF